MILNEFQAIFNKHVLPYIEHELGHSEYTEPVFYTLKAGKTKRPPTKSRWVSEVKTESHL